MWSEAHLRSWQMRELRQKGWEAKRYIDSGAGASLVSECIVEAMVKLEVNPAAIPGGGLVGVNGQPVAIKVMECLVSPEFSCWATTSTTATSATGWGSSIGSGNRVRGVMKPHTATPPSSAQLGVAVRWRSPFGLNIPLGVLLGPHRAFL